MSWHYIFLYIDNDVSLTNLMLSDNSDRDSFYLFQLEIKRIPQIQLCLLHFLAYSLYCQLGSVENETCHDLNFHIVNFPDNIPVALHNGYVSLNRYLVFPKMDMLYNCASAITHEVKFKASVDVFSKMWIQKGAI